MTHKFRDSAKDASDELQNAGITHVRDEDEPFVRYDFSEQPETARLYVNPGGESSCRWAILKAIVHIARGKNSRIGLSFGNLTEVKLVDSVDKRHDAIVGYTTNRKTSEQIAKSLRNHFYNLAFGPHCPDENATVPTAVETESQWPQVGVTDSPSGGTSFGEEVSNMIARAILEVGIPQVGGDVETQADEISAKVAWYFAKRNENPCKPFSA